ncbi:MAG: SAM hydrolase/SAM-dependent halogenase family protein [Candidatus Sumerlaeaceae bacterium]
MPRTKCSSLSDSQRPVVALLTDFGWEGWYVGAMKGVILSICPQAHIVDLTHGVSPHSIAEGALLLNATQRCFPTGTIFVAVVDPGVGTVREPIVAQADGRIFVAPNNGLLGLVLEGAKEWDCRLISNKKYFLAQVSSTFHGRDIFAPVAAHIAAGVPIENIAPQKTECFRLAAATASYDCGYIEGNIIYFDRFGNAVTNITRELFEKNFPTKTTGKKGKKSRPAEPAIRITVNNYELTRICKTFGDVKPGEPVAYWGSMGTLEIGINLGNAHIAMGLRLLDKVTIKKVGEYVA